MNESSIGYGSSLESWLDEEGIREEVTSEAIKAVLAAQIAAETLDTLSRAARAVGRTLHVALL